MAPWSSLRREMLWTATCCRGVGPCRQIRLGSSRRPAGARFGLRRRARSRAKTARRAFGCVAASFESAIPPDTTMWLILLDRRSSRMVVQSAAIRATELAVVRYLGSAMARSGVDAASRIPVASGWPSATCAQRHTPRPPSAIQSCGRSTATHHVAVPRTITITLPGERRKVNCLVRI